MPRRETAAGRADFDVANRLFFRLYQCSNLLHKNGARHVADFGATTQQWAVLGALSRPSVRATGMTVKSLVEYLLLSRQNLTAVLERLEARGWIDRVKDPEDGRNRLIRMTAEGSRNWGAMQAPIEAFYAGALTAFSEPEQARLCEMLDRLKNGLNEV
jgi:DNA-binding MarR family transcriptional regulator